MNQHPGKAEKTLNIIHSCGSPSWGGLEMYAVDTAEALAKRGHQVTFLCAPDSSIGKQAHEKGLHVRPILSGVFQPMLKIWQLLNFGSYNVIHTHLSHDLGALVPAIRLSGWKGKLFFTRQMISGISKRDVFHRFLYRRIDGLFAVSNAVRQNLLDTCPVSPEKVQVLWNTIRVNQFDARQFDKALVRKELGIEEDDTVVGMVGRITLKKGHKEFLEAAHIILKSTDKPVKFLIVGGASYGEEDFEKEIRRLALEELQLNEQVIFTGFRSDISRMMAAMDIFAFPSYKEAFGITLLEAMAMEIPIVASSSGGVPDIIVPGETGLLTPPKNSRELAQALQKLIEDKNLQKKFAAAGKKRVLQYFDFEDYIKKLEGWYFPISSVK